MSDRCDDDEEEEDFVVFELDEADEVGGDAVEVLVSVVAGASETVVVLSEDEGLWLSSLLSPWLPLLLTLSSLSMVMSFRMCFSDRNRTVLSNSCAVSGSIGLSSPDSRGNAG